MKRALRVLGAIALVAGWATCGRAGSPTWSSNGRTSAKNDSSWTNSVSSGVKSGWNKMTDIFTPETPVTPAPDPTSLQTPAKPGPGLYVAIGRMCEEKGQFDDAEQRYRQALKLIPNDVGAMLALAHLRDRQNRMQEALQMYEEAAKMHPREARVYNDWGLCLAKRQMMAESVPHLRRAAELQPEKVLYRNNLAAVLVELDQRDEALRHLASVQDEATANYNLGYLLYRKGQTQAACTYFAKALEYRPAFEEARVFLERLSGQPTAVVAQGQPWQQPVENPHPAAKPRIQSRPVIAPIDRPLVERPDGVRRAAPPERPSQPAVSPLVRPTVQGPAPSRPVHQEPVNRPQMPEIQRPYWNVQPAPSPREVIPLPSVSSRANPAASDSAPGPQDVIPNAYQPSSGPPTPLPRIPATW